MADAKKRLGILTSGGDCPGLNAVIRGAVKSAGQLGYDCIGFRKGYEGLVDPVTYVPLNNRNTSGILTQGGTILGSTNKGRFAATVGADQRVEIDPDQAYFWTPECQAKEREADEDIARGDYEDFDNMEDFLSSLDREVF